MKVASKCFVRVWSWLWNNAEANLGLDDIQDRSLVSFSRDSGCLNANNLSLLISLISFNLPDKSEDTTHPAESLPRLNSDPATNAYLFVIEDLMTICTSTAIQSPVFVALMSFPIRHR